MAKPDCDDGWLKYAHELDAALSLADFSKGARVVLHEVFSQVFGPVKARAARVSPTELGARLGKCREHFSRSVTELTRANVLSRQPDGSLRFNKDYETWVHGGAPLLASVEISYCRSAPKRAMSHAFPKNPEGNNASTEGRNNTGHGEGGERNRTGHAHRNRTGHGGVTEQVTRTAAPLRTPLVGDLRIETLSERERATDSVSGSPPGAGRVEPIAAAGLNTPADVHRVLGAAEELHPMTSMRTMCRQWLVNHRAERITRFLGKAVGKADPVAYVQGCLNKPDGTAAAVVIPDPAEKQRQIDEMTAKLKARRAARADAEN